MIHKTVLVVLPISFNVTIIMITHDRQAVQYTNHVLQIGRTPFFGTKQAYLESPQGRLFLEEGGDQHG